MVLLNMGVNETEITELNSICILYDIVLRSIDDFTIGCFSSVRPSDLDTFHLFAWDGMSYLGNELYTTNNLNGSMDPAMALSSTISFFGVQLKYTIIAV